MKRNIISIVLVFALMASFAACKKLPEGSYEADPTTNKYAGLVGEGETVSPELEQFLETLDTSDPAKFEEQFEQMLEEEIVDPDLEFGEELIDDSNSNKIDVELDDAGRPVHDDLEKSYLDIVNGEKFTVDVVIKTVTNGQEMKLPIMMMSDNGKLYMEAVMPVEGKGSMRVNMLANGDGKCYIIFPAMRAYMAVPGEAFGSLDGMIDSEIITDDAASKGDYIESREVELDGKKYICEVYQDGDSTIKYYFDGADLRRVEYVSGENVTIMQINEVSDKADSSKFNLPKNYFDITTIMGTADIQSMY